MTMPNVIRIDPVMASLVDAYLTYQKGAFTVLRDWCVEQGYPTPGTANSRALFVARILPPPLSHHLAADFVETLADRPGIESRLRQVLVHYLDRKRSWTDREGSLGELKDLRHSYRVEIATLADPSTGWTAGERRRTLIRLAQNAMLADPSAVVGAVLPQAVLMLTAEERTRFLGDGPASSLRGPEAAIRHRLHQLQQPQSHGF